MSAAIAEFKEALAADPDFAMPHLEMAILAGWHDAPDEDARSHMESAARNAGRLPDRERRLVLGYKAFIEQRHTEATRILDALALDYPLDKQVLYVAGEAFWHGDTPGGFARAAALFRAALDLDPAYLVAYIHLFEWLERFGPKGEALARAERAARFRPSAEAQAMVARALGASDRWADALVAARSAASVAGGEHFESAYAQAEVLFAAGDRAEGERSLRKWLAPDVRPGPRRVAAEVLARPAGDAGAGTGRARGLPRGGRRGRRGAVRRLRRLDARLPGPHRGRSSRPPAAPSRRPIRPRHPGPNLDGDRKAWLLAWVGMDEAAAARAQALPPGSLSERQYAAVARAPGAAQPGRHRDPRRPLPALPVGGPQFLLGLALAGEGRHAEALQAFEVVRIPPPHLRARAGLRPPALGRPARRRVARPAWDGTRRRGRG